MTRKELEEYRSKIEEITELTIQMSQLQDGDSAIGNSTIMDYRTGYPIPQSVIGIDWDRCNRLEQHYQRQIEQLRADCMDVEKFIENINDSMTRRIFRLYYINGLSQDKIAKKVHLDKSSVSRKIENFLKLQQMQQKS